jgi:protein arginine N-methyltransferase 2
LKTVPTENRKRVVDNKFDAFEVKKQFHNATNKVMDPLADAGANVDVEVQQILLASANHDIRALRHLLQNTAATVQDPETGCSPLHAAIAACELDQEEETTPAANGDTDTNGTTSAENEDEKRAAELEKGAETVRFLLRNGAIWNELDASDETPGCVARRLGLSEIYELIVDAGVRAELLLGRLEEYQAIADDDDDDDDEDTEMSGQPEGGDSEVTDPALSTSAQIIEDVSMDNQAYLASGLTWTPSTLLDASQNGVMMSWEYPLMEAHAKSLALKEGLRVLNIGHGLGIIDTLFQGQKPVSHHIIEAHPEVLKRMREQGWMGKPGVVVHEGRWQDVLPNLVSGPDEVVFDAIFFDTFAEEYKHLREFFSEWVVQLMDSEGRFGFFNGLGADRQVCADVYRKVSSQCRKIPFEKKKYR